MKYSTIFLSGLFAAILFLVFGGILLPMLLPSLAHLLPAALLAGIIVACTALICQKLDNRN